MKLINSSYQILEQEPGLDGIFKMIEKAGRTCYKSEDKITEDSAKKFVDMLVDRGHTAVLEQGTVYLMIPITTNHSGFSITAYQNNPYSIVVATSGLLFKDEYGDPCDMWCITSNLRVLYENGLMEDLENYLCEPTEYHAKRVAVRFICDRGVSHELVRHRVFSFAQESTRYCNYSKDKFGNELTFIRSSRYCYIPSTANVLLEYSYEQAEQTYLALLRQKNVTPQLARQVLPNALKTEVVMTGFTKDWEHFFKLRCDNAAHPDMRALAVPLKEEFINRKYI